jgi:hypothetical protein
MKYSKDELKKMAEESLKAKLAGDERYFMLIMLLSHTTGLSPDDCESRIKAMSA